MTGFEFRTTGSYLTVQFFYDLGFIRSGGPRYLPALALITSPKLKLNRQLPFKHDIGPRWSEVQN